MIIYFIIILLIILYSSYKSENFNNYKSIVVTPNKLVYQPQTINVNNTGIVYIKNVKYVLKLFKS